MSYREVVLDETTPSEATLRERNLEHARQRRGLEQADALHFLVYGHDEHVERGCVFQEEGGERCSRDYDPRPYPEAALTNPNDYVGTGLGALYGLPGWERFVWELAGWNVSIPLTQEAS